MSNAWWPVKNGGLEIVITPNKVVKAAIIETIPNSSPKKKNANIVTKIGVLKEMTEVSPGLI